MPIPLSNIDKVRFTTQYPVDKVVRTYTGSFSVANFVQHQEHDISHDLGEKVFLIADFSIDNLTFVPNGVIMVPDINTPANQLNGVASVSATQIKFYLSNFSGATRTIYYRVQLLWPR